MNSYTVQETTCSQQKNALLAIFLIFQDGLLWTFDTEKCVESNFQQLIELALGLSTHKKKLFKKNWKSWGRVLKSRVFKVTSSVVSQQTKLDFTNILYSF